MTAENIAREHVAYRRRCGWTWGQIIAEVDACRAAVGLPPSDCISKGALVAAFQATWMLGTDDGRQRLRRAAA